MKAISHHAKAAASRNAAAKSALNVRPYVGRAPCKGIRATIGDKTFNAKSAKTRRKTLKGMRLVHLRLRQVIREVRRRASRCTHVLDSGKNVPPVEER